MKRRCLRRNFFGGLAVAVACALSQATDVRAGSTLGLADTGAPTVNTGNINTATIFNIGDLVSTAAQSGFFVGLPAQTFGAVTFNDTLPGSLAFSSGPFGSFTSTSITEISNVPGAVAFFVLGNYVAGSYDSEVSGAASFTISFTQTPPSTGGISDSGSFSTPPAPFVPEPTSMALLGIGMTGFFAFRRLFRRTAVA